ncbi:MAG: glycosyltransferase family 39 protein [Candidatus Omnitrophica bacterium]|nr:glycosyltransferase family 39 protein [Candidatus Omnitrophota bacterium]
MITSRYSIDKKEILFICVIFLLAILFRIAYFADYKNSAIYPVLPYSDSYSYFLWAKDIASGDILGSHTFMKWPLYAYFLAFLLKLFKDSIAVVYFFQYILGAVNSVLIYFIGKKVFNEKVGFIAGLLSSCYGLFVFYDSLLMYNTLSLFLNLLFFLLLLNIQDVFKKKKLFWAGALLGISTLAQANILAFGILAVFWILWKRKLDFAKLSYCLFLFIAGLVITIGPVSLRNYLVAKDKVLIAANIGINYYLGNNPESTGTFFCPANLALNQEDMFRDARIIANTESGRRLKASEVSAFWFKKSLTYIKNNPKEYVKLILRKINYLFNSQESVHDLEYYSIKDKIRIFRVMLLDLKFLLPFALLGMFLGLRKFKQAALLYFAVIILSLTIILFFVSSRYRLGLVPFFAIFASFGIFTLWQTVKEKRFFKLGILCAALLLFFLITSHDFFKNNETIAAAKSYGGFFSHFHRAQRLIDNADYLRAIQELKLADYIQPDNRYVILSFGIANYYLQNFKVAEDNFKKLVGLFPLYVDAYYNLGFLYNQEKRFSEAEVILEKAVLLDPENVETHFELGRAYKAEGNYKEADEQFLIALDKINRWRSEEIVMIERERQGLKK